MDLIYLIKNELKIENVNSLLSISDLNKTDQIPSIAAQEDKLTNMKENREALGSVNLRENL